MKSKNYTWTKNLLNLDSNAKKKILNMNNSREKNLILL